MDKNYRAPVACSLSGIILITILAVGMKLWVLTAIPIGFLFGFFLQKGDLCGSSAFSEVLVMRDRRKIAGLWVLIAVSMVGFAVLDQLGNNLHLPDGTPNGSLEVSTLGPCSDSQARRIPNKDQS